MQRNTISKRIVKNDLFMKYIKRINEGLSSDYVFKEGDGVCCGNSGTMLLKLANKAGYPVYSTYTSDDAIEFHKGRFIGSSFFEIKKLINKEDFINFMNQQIELQSDAKKYNL